MRRGITYARMTHCIVRIKTLYKYHRTIGIRLSLGRRLDNILPVAQRTNAFTNGVVRKTRVRIPNRTFLLKEMLARASYYKHISLGPQDLDRSLGRHVRPYTETRHTTRPKDPAVPRGGEC